MTSCFLYGPAISVQTFLSYIDDFVLAREPIIYRYSQDISNNIF